jgi:hypothetical protein
MMNLTQKQYTPSDKILILVCSVAVFVFVFILVSFKGTQVKLSKNETSQINYEMAKLQNAENLYSLENREIEMDYKALEAKKVAAQANAKKTNDKTHKVNTAAAQAAAKVATSQQAMAAAQRRALLANQKRFQAKLAVESVSNVSTDSDLKQARNVTQDSYKPLENELPIDAPTKNKPSFDQWKSEIFAAQNKEVIIKLVAALKKGDISAEDYQKLVSEMLASKDDKMIGLALYALRSVPSYASYIQLVQLEGQISSNYAAYLQQSLMAYNQVVNLVYLKQSLLSKNKQVVMKTLEIIKSGIINIKSGEISQSVDPRFVRGADASQFSLKKFNIFLPELQELSRSADQDIILLANQNITLIDDLVYVAVN